MQFNIEKSVSLCIYTDTMLYVVHLTFLRLFRKTKSLLQNFNAMKKSKALSRPCKLSYFKMTGRSCTDKVREKEPLFQNVTFFSVIYCSDTLSIYVLNSFKLLITAVI